MKTENLESIEQLQSYFIKRVEKFIVSKGRKLIGWEEILQGGLAPEATVTSWTGIKGGIDAAKQKHDAVMTPSSFLYLNMQQADPKTEPAGPDLNDWGEYLPMIKTYSFEPVPSELSQAESKYILGVQACLWAEFISTPEQLEYMTIPRIFAVSEIGWTTKENKNWDDFLVRTNEQVLRMKAFGYNYSQSALTASLVLPKK